MSILLDAIREYVEGNHQSWKVVDGNVGTMCIFIEHKIESDIISYLSIDEAYNLVGGIIDDDDNIEEFFEDLCLHTILSTIDNFIKTVENKNAVAKGD